MRSHAVGRSAGHERRTEPRAFFAAGDARADEVHPLSLEAFPCAACVSLNQELPPSMTMSPFSSSGMSLSMVMSTGEPALIIIMIRRGRSIDLHELLQRLRRR